LGSLVPKQYNITTQKKVMKKTIHTRNTRPTTCNAIRRLHPLFLIDARGSCNPCWSETAVVLKKRESGFRESTFVGQYGTDQHGECMSVACFSNMLGCIK